MTSIERIDTAGPGKSNDARVPAGTLSSNVAYTPADVPADPGRPPTKLVGGLGVALGIDHEQQLKKAP